MAQEITYDVVLNDEEQYSVWESASQPPLGWHREGFTGTRGQCLAYIDQIWADIRPRSVRER